MTEVELQTLRGKLIAGDTKPLESIFMMNKADCCNVLLSKNLADRIEIEDIYTEAIIILHRNLVSYKIEKLSSVKSYLISICINLAKKKLDYTTRTQKKLEEVRLLFYENNDNSIDDVDNKNDLIDLCKRAFVKLSVKCQKIITGYYINRLSMKEIAKELGLSSGDVAKTLKSRCYKTLLTYVSELRKANNEFI